MLVPKVFCPLGWFIWTVFLGAANKKITENIPLKWRKKGFFSCIQEVERRQKAGTNNPSSQDLR